MKTTMKVSTNSSHPQFTFSQTTFSPNSFLGKRRHVARSTTLLYQLQVLKDTGRYDAFKLKWHASYSDAPTVWPVPNHLFWDSDVAKWIEGACYFLHEGGNDKIEQAIHELVDMIRNAQSKDGYISIHFTVVEPEKRFSNLRDLHELYNAGHLIEAAIAHYIKFKNDVMLAPILRYVDLLCRTFGEDACCGYPGHPEIELALLRLYTITNNKEHLRLARFFITERGNTVDKHYYDIEAEKRGDRPNEMPRYYPQKQSYWYQQAHIPILEQQTLEGHSVRAMYLLTAVADLVRLDKSANDYKNALFRLWDNMVGKKMYVTGGIGAVAQWEGFGIDYFLPQGTDEGGCYAETCAAIGVMMLGERILQLDLDARYADIVELALYNAMLTGMSIDGKKFTYVNQMASSDSDLSERHGWFECACCPPNVTRTLGCLGGYLWTPQDEVIDVHLYTSATLFAGQTQLIMKTGWPWDGKVEFEIQGEAKEIRLRIPGWAKEYKLSTPENDNIQMLVKHGYLYLPVSFTTTNPKFSLDIPLLPRIIRSHPYAGQTISIARGPIIYCLEDFDNPWVNDHFKKTAIIINPNLKTYEIHDTATQEIFIGIKAIGAGVQLNVNQWQSSTNASWNNHGEVKQCCDVEEKMMDLKFIPYYFRANRGGRGIMRVGLRECTCSSG